MKKFFVLALAALAVLNTGCVKTPDLDLYMAGVYAEGETTTGNVKGNELYCLVTDGVTAINAKYNYSILAENENEVLEAYGKALAELKALKEKSDAALASGKDFGATKFTLPFYCKAFKGTDEIKKSECFKFEYDSNTRIISDTEVEINTVHAASVSGQVPVEVADTKMELEIRGWKLYDEKGNLSDAGLIKKVEVAQDAVETSIFDVYYQASQGAFPGSFYILVTFVDKADPDTVFDLKVNVRHETAE